MPPGRRRGDADTRGTIIGAARAEFLDRGYYAATIRAIARRAQVDPALIYHYFNDKPTLYAATLSIPTDPRQIQDEVRASPQAPGVTLVLRFLTQWESGPGQPGQAFVTLAQATASSPEAARGVREFLFDRVWGRADGAVEDADWRRTAVSSFLLGMAWNRYVLRTEPIASAPVADVAARFGPVIEGVMRGSGLAGREPAN
ncbi:MAG TPA: TetR family transcriptional regulator [Streptosporangiaceae bacterium]|jgi:AcrR family transcriptional regulator